MTWSNGPRGGGADVPGLWGISRAARWGISWVIARHLGGGPADR
jgi:hypothetical protein